MTGETKNVLLSLEKNVDRARDLLDIELKINFPIGDRVRVAHARGWMYGVIQNVRDAQICVRSDSGRAHWKHWQHVELIGDSCKNALESA